MIRETSLVLKQHACQGNIALELLFLAEWNCQCCQMQRSGMRLRNRLGACSFLHWAVGKTSAAVLLYDLTRRTPNPRFLSFVLDELLSTGLEVENIVLVIASGIHNPSSKFRIVELVGQEIQGSCYKESSGNV